MKVSWIYQSGDGTGNFGLSMCPGKNLEKGRDGKTYKRSIIKDVESLQARNIQLIICLLNDYEIRSVGCDHVKYSAACQKYKVELFKYPIIEMAPPEDVAEFHHNVILRIDQTLKTGGNVMAHCRGGIGRAGTVAACYLAFKNGTSRSESIKLVRERRDRRCVESRK